MQHVDVLKQMNSTTVVNNITYSAKQKPLNLHEDYHLCNWEKRCWDEVSKTYDLLIVAGNGSKEMQGTDDYLPIPTIGHLQQLFPKNSNLFVPQRIAEDIEKAHKNHYLLNSEDRVRAKSMQALPVQSFVPIQDAHYIVNFLYSSLLLKRKDDTLLCLPTWEALPSVKIRNSIDCTRLKTFTGYHDYHKAPKLPSMDHDLRKHNLLLLGGSDTNLITSLVLGIYETATVHFGFHGDSEILHYTDNNAFQTYTKQSTCPETKLGLLFMQPNPFNEEKVVIIAAGLGRYGTKAAMSALANPTRLQGVNRHVVVIDNPKEDKDSHYYEVLV